MISLENTPSPIYHLAYISTMTLSASLRSSILADIAEVSKKNNTIHGIKGLIIFKQGKFLQYLEGDKARIIKLYQAIRQDTRHKNVRMIAQGIADNSRFANQDIYYFGMDESVSGEEITPLMDKFDTYHWKPEQIEQVVRDFAQQSPLTVMPYYAHGVRVESYLFTLFKQFILRHAVFLTLQLLFVVLFTILAIYLLA